MGKRDKEKALRGVGKRSPAVKCSNCKEWYSPGDAEIARPHVKGICTRST